MPEETKNAAETSEVTATQDGVAGAVENAEENATDASFTDTAENGSSEGNAGDADKPEKAAKPHQTKEQNSEFARRRREAERQKELKELRDNTVIKTLGGKNPYTGGEMKDSADVEEFLTMQEIEKNGGDPVADFAKFHKESARRAQEKADSEAQTAEWYRKDSEDFKEKYPDVDLLTLAEDADFADYADGKVGKKPLADIYAGYLKLKGGNAGKSADDKTARAMAAQMIANRKAAVGSVANANGGNSDFISREDAAKMSVQECEKNYDKIIKSMPLWK